MENYECLGQIGEGTYGIVLKARHKITGQLVAIKKFKESDQDEQVRKTALREIRILKQLKHENIVTLIEVFRRKGKLYLVFEYVERTILEDMEKNPGGLEKVDAKKCIYQLLKSLSFIHDNGIIHRDVKPENLLISKNGVLKLCDFGFARTLGRPGAKYTDYVATRWYRAPELLVGDTEYSKPVDIWAVGCLFGELTNGMPLFPGESDIDQLYHMMKTFGTLCKRHLDIFKKNPFYQGIKLPVVKIADSLQKRFLQLDRSALNLMQSCLHYEPVERQTCAELLNHPYFAGFREWFENENKLAVERDKQEAADLARRALQSRSKAKSKRSKHESRNGSKRRSKQSDEARSRRSPRAEDKPRRHKKSSFAVEHDSRHNNDRSGRANMDELGSPHDRSDQEGGRDQRAPSRHGPLSKTKAAREKDRERDRIDLSGVLREQGNENQLPPASTARRRNRDRKLKERERDERKSSRHAHPDRKDRERDSRRGGDTADRLDLLGSIHLGSQNDSRGGGDGGYRHSQVGLSAVNSYGFPILRSTTPRPVRLVAFPQLASEDASSLNPTDKRRPISRGAECFYPQIPFRNLIPQPGGERNDGDRGGQSSGVGSNSIYRGGGSRHGNRFVDSGHDSDRHDRHDVARGGRHAHNSWRGESGKSGLSHHNFTKAREHSDANKLLMRKLDLPKKLMNALPEYHELVRPTTMSGMMNLSGARQMGAGHSSQIGESSMGPGLYGSSKHDYSYRSMKHKHGKQFSKFSLRMGGKGNKIRY